MPKSSEERLTADDLSALLQLLGKGTNAGADPKRFVPKTGAAIVNNLDYGTLGSFSPLLGVQLDKGSLNIPAGKLISTPGIIAHETHHYNEQFRDKSATAGMPEGALNAVLNLLYRSTPEITLQSGNDEASAQLAAAYATLPAGKSLIQEVVARNEEAKKRQDLVTGKSAGVELTPALFAVLDKIMNPTPVNVDAVTR